jgi:RNA polymerase sigma-70 factor (ECF subfamily)
MPSTPPASDPRDEEIRALVARGEIDRATEHALRAYGPELIGWLCAILASETDAYDAFSQLSEQLWKSLRTFEGRCSIRTWCYMIARQSASAVRSQPRRQHEDLVPSVPSVAHAVTHVWNTTRQHANMVEDVYARIRRQLDEDDQVLLVLRVDRDLAWRDIAIVMLGSDAGDDALTRKAGALRKQFERVKEQLRKLAAEHLPQ